MPRRLTDELNELRIQDNISGSEIFFYYRMPTTAERAAYANESFRRRGNKIEPRVVATRQKFGKLILSGIREGDFEARRDDGTCKPLSSTPGSENYLPGWKDIVAAHAGDLLELLAAHVLDGSASITTTAAGDTGKGEDVERD